MEAEEEDRARKAKEEAEAAENKRKMLEQLEEAAEQRRKDLKAEKLAKSGMTKLQMDKKEGQKKEFSIAMIKCIMKKNKGADKFKLG